MTQLVGVKESSTLHVPETTVACKNCGHRYEGRYCPACGQRADTHRINWHYIGHEIPHSVWHVDHGIVFTIKELFTRPGYTIREFLEGKRVKHYRPLALVLLLGAVVTFVLHSLDMSLMEETQRSMREVTGDVSGGSARVNEFQARTNAFAEKYMNLIQILMLPVTSLFTWLMFRKKGLNYPEHLVTNTFLANVGILINLVTIFCYKWIGGTAGTNSVIQSVSMIAGFVYTMWAFSQLFRSKVGAWGASWRAATATVLSIISIGLVAVMIGGLYGFLVVAPELRKQKEAEATKAATHAPIPKK
jgi:hypothetical protein